MGDEETRRSRKRDDSAISGDDIDSDTNRITKIPKLLNGNEDEEEDAEGVEEEMVAEVMRRLEREIRCPPPPLPPPPAINVRQELCGPSFSDSSSTVMASVDTRTGGGGASYFCGGTEAAITGWNVGLVGNRSAWQPVAEVCGGAGDRAEEDEGCLGRVLSQSWVEIEDCLFLNGDGN